MTTHDTSAEVVPTNALEGGARHRWRRSGASTRRCAASAVAGALLAFGLVVAAATPAQAASQEFAVTSSCTYRVSGFYDWGKAAASNRDLKYCSYLRVELIYGTMFSSWVSSAGPTLNSYVKTVAGYYDWKRAGGAVSNNGYVWNYIYA